MSRHDSCVDLLPHSDLASLTVLSKIKKESSALE
jgi:hypothetical protein